MTGYLLNCASAEQWKRVGIRSHHGVNLSLAALHSKKSCGIGEFFDLLPLIAWCKKVGMDVIQLLPLNDSGCDPSPYNALSSCALNPLYLSLHALPYLGKHPFLRKKLSALRKLSESPRISYSDVQSHKLHFLHAYFDHTATTHLKSRAFHDFVKEHPWVEAYGLFKVLKDRLGQNSWTTWPSEVKTPSPAEYEELVKHFWNEISFYVLLQFLSFQQLQEVKAYASSQGVLLKGDIPILVSAESVDVWRLPTLFDCSLSAGAPPDQYNREGQNWGFPLFRWPAHQKERYAWWIQRLRTASCFYDAYRIDHVVGFFRIWAIPHGKPAGEGAFTPSDTALWVPQGKGVLEMMLANTSMLPIAEDLGTVPDAVRTCLLELGLCGTKVIRWERAWHSPGREFLPYASYPTISMTTVSTHDSETLQQWWRDLPEEARAFAAFKHWNYAPSLSIEQRREILRDSHRTPSLFHINLLQEYLALFPSLVWPNPDDERINVPGTLLQTNWTYRFRPSVEEIVSHSGLQLEIQNLLPS
jgi:4-alpha-glucanotransferase